MSILNMLYWSGSWWYAIYDLSLTNDETNEKVIVKWFEYMPANWVKTVVRYKTGSAPTSPTDWTLAVEETTKNQYSTTWYWVSWLSDNTTYYFSVFALDIDGTMIDVQSSQIKTDFVFGWYQRVEYIQSSWTQYINTNIKLNNTNIIELIATLTWITSWWSWDKLYWWWDSWTCLFLQWNTWDNWSWWDRRIRMVNYSNDEYYKKSVDSISAITTWVKHTYKHTNTQFYIDWTSQWTCSSSTFTMNIWLNIFANANSNGTWRQKSCYKLFSMKIYNWSNQVIYDFYPVYRKSDNVIWLLEIKNKVFYTNAWTWTFTKGWNI